MSMEAYSAPAGTCAPVRLALPPALGRRSDTLLTARRALPDGGGVEVPLHRPDELGGIEGLADVISRSCQSAAHVVKHAVFAAEQEDRQIAILLVMTDHLADLIPIHAREEDIQQHQVRLRIGNARERAQPIARRHHLDAL